jgi:hypothetical protein
LRTKACLLAPASPVSVARDGNRLPVLRPTRAAPHQLAADAESDGGAGPQITFTRIIVHADGHREIEGVTPKLPTPEPDDTKAIEP